MLDHLFTYPIDDITCEEKHVVCIEDEKASAILIKPIEKAEDLMSGRSIFKDACIVARGFRHYDYVFVQYPLAVDTQTYARLLASFKFLLDYARELKEQGVIVVPYLEELSPMYLKLIPYPLDMRVGTTPSQAVRAYEELKYPIHVMNARQITNEIRELAIATDVSVELASQDEDSF